MITRLIKGLSNSIRYYSTPINMPKTCKKNIKTIHFNIEKDQPKRGYYPWVPKIKVDVSKINKSISKKNSFK